MAIWDFLWEYWLFKKIFGGRHDNDKHSSSPVSSVDSRDYDSCDCDFYEGFKYRHNDCGRDSLIDDSFYDDDDCSGGYGLDDDYDRDFGYDSDDFDDDFDMFD